MCSNISIAEFLEIDKNIEVESVKKEEIKGIEYKILNAKLTYTAEKCPKCGSCNENKSIVKNGSKVVKALINKVANKPTIIKIKKQRFYCKHCNRTFIAKTSLTDKACFISKDIKKSIVMDLCKDKSMKLISQEHFVSPNTVARVLRSTEKKVSRHYLPEAFGIDEFKSLKSVVSAMSVNITDLTTGKIHDLLPDRRKRYLREYFLTYPLYVRKKVKIITTDMYSPYIDIAKELFPNAVIVIDKFHIVQLLNRNLNSFRIELMKAFYKYTHEYKVLKTYWRIPLAKHWLLNRIKFHKSKHYKGFTTSYDIMLDILSISSEFSQAYNFYQLFLQYIENRDVEGFRQLISTDLKECPPCFKKSLKTLQKLGEYAVNALVYSYSNGPVEGKNNMIKVVKRVSYGFRSFRNMKARILLRERVKIVNGNVQKVNNTILDAAA